MAGKSIMGTFDAVTMVVKRLSAIPDAILPIVLYEAGTMAMMSAHLARSIWGIPSPKTSEKHLPLVRIFRVYSDTNLFPFSVKTTETEAPLFCKSLTSSGILNAAIPPVTPRRTFLPSRLSFIRVYYPVLYLALFKPLHCKYCHLLICFCKFLCLILP